MQDGADEQVHQERKKQPKAKKSCGCLLLSGLLILGILHSCGLIPMSRTAPRSFVITRDYQDMKKIFNISRLPESFKLEAVDYPFAGGLPLDGHRPAKYKARVDGSEYEKLISGLRDKKHAFNTNYGMYLAVKEFNPELSEYARGAAYENPPMPHPEQFTHITKSPRGGNRSSYIVADIRTSNPVYLYITTTVPHEG